MNGAAAIDVSPLPNLVQKSRGSLWWGMVLLLTVESMVFGTLISSYYYLKMVNVEWPPPGADPKLLLPTINTVILTASSVPMFLADRGIAEGNQKRLVWGAAAAAALATVFLILKVIEYSSVDYRWDDHAYGSIVWTIIGFHSGHVASVVLKTIVVMVLGYRGYFNAKRNLGVQINGLYWHFVVLVWIPLYVVLYWTPRWS